MVKKERKSVTFTLISLKCSQRNNYLKKKITTSLKCFIFLLLNNMLRCAFPKVHGWIYIFLYKLETKCSIKTAYNDTIPS